MPPARLRQGARGLGALPGGALTRARGEPAQALKDSPEEEREGLARAAKMRTMGNIRLIAELFKQDVVNEKILAVCIQEMLGDGKGEPHEDDVEVPPPPAPKHTPPPPPPPPPRPGSQTGMASVAGGVLPTRVQGAAQTGAQRALQRPGCASPCPTLPCAGR